MKHNIKILKSTPTITEMFIYCKAPLKNTRWSWGAVSDQGDIFLRVWENEIARIEDKHYYRVTHLAVYKDKLSHPGIKERLRHVEEIRLGRSSFMIKCRAKNPKVILTEPLKYNELISIMKISHIIIYVIYMYKCIPN